MKNPYAADESSQNQPIPAEVTESPALPWAENELYDMMLEHLERRHANIAAGVVQDGYLEFAGWELAPLGEHVLLDIRIKVAPDRHPATMRGRSHWSHGKISHGEEVEQRARDALTEVMSGVERVAIRSFGFESVSPGELERLAAHRAALTDRAANNQANVHPETPAKIVRLGLRFRSYPEVFVWEALINNIQEGECVSPLPVVSSGRFERIEPDFLLFTRRQHALIEVDGPFHQEDFRKSRERTAVLENVGFQVWRVNARDVDTVLKADAWVLDLLKRLREGLPRIDA